MGDQGQSENQGQNQGQGQNNGGDSGRLDRAEIQRLVRDILNGDNAESKITKIMTDNYNYRQQRRDSQHSDHNNSSNPALEAYQALGTVDEIKKLLEDGKTAQNRLATLEQEKKLADFARVAKVNAEVLTLVGAGLKFEIDTVGDKKIPMVVDSAGKRTPLRDYVDSNWASLKNSIFTEAQRGQGSRADQRDDYDDTDDQDYDDSDDDQEYQDDDQHDDQDNERADNNKGRSHGQGRNLSMIRQSSGHSGNNRNTDPIDDHIDQLTAKPSGWNPLMPASQRK